MLSAEVPWWGSRLHRPGVHRRGTDKAPSSQRRRMLNRRLGSELPFLGPGPVRISSEWPSPSSNPPSRLEHARALTDLGTELRAARVTGQIQLGRCARVSTSLIAAAPLPSLHLPETSSSPSGLDLGVPPSPAATLSRRLSAVSPTWPARG